MAKKNTIPDGDVSTHAAQLKHSAPVTDTHSALHALANRNAGTTQGERDDLVNAASAFVPDAADNADAYDDSCADMTDQMGG